MSEFEGYPSADQMFRCGNADVYGSVEEMRAAETSYISGGSPQLTLLEKHLVHDIVGRSEAEEETVGALCFGTLGRSGLVQFFETFAAGRQIVTTPKIFAGTFVYLFKSFGRKTRGQVNFLWDINDLDALRRAIEKRETAVVFFETISNPLLRPARLQEICDLIRAEYPDVSVFVDETFTGGLPTSDGRQFSAIKFGAHASFVSLTKWLCGDHQARGGAVFTTTEQMHEDLAIDRRIEGRVLDPEDAWYLLRRNNILSASLSPRSMIQERLMRASWVAMELARALQNANVPVIYPGLVSDPDHEILVRMGLDHFGGILSIDTGSIEEARRVTDALAQHEEFNVANSFGGPDTRIEPIYDAAPVFGHPIMENDMRIPRGLIRISCGHGIGTDRIDGLIEHAVQVLAP